MKISEPLTSIVGGPRCKRAASSNASPNSAFPSNSSPWDALTATYRIRINTLALGLRLPTILPTRDLVETAGLISYGANFPDLFRRAADLVDKILRGAKPADIPVEQPTQFDLVLNLTTAKALGLTVPPTLLSAALPAVSRFAWAQAYLSRPVRIIVGFPAGGGADIVARLIGQWLSERLGQPFVVENRPGGGGNIGTEAVVRAPADGYTLLLCGTPNATNAALYDKLNFNFIRDIAPVAGITRVPNVTVVNPSVPAKTVPEFIAYAKANPGKVNMASAGVGSPQHVYGELFKMMAGVDMVHVP